MADEAPLGRLMAIAKIDHRNENDDPYIRSQSEGRPCASEEEAKDLALQAPRDRDAAIIRDRDGRFWVYEIDELKRLPGGSAAFDRAGASGSGVHIKALALPKGATLRSFAIGHGVSTRLEKPHVDAEGARRAQQLEQSFREAGLVGLHELAERDAELGRYAEQIIVDLELARPHNIVPEAVYGSLDKCYLRPEVAEKLARAQKELSALRPGYRLRVADATRPRSAQRRLWEKVRGTPIEKYIARPEPGSMHGHGAAVDVTIVDAHGKELDMGTKMHHLGREAELGYNDELGAQQVANRKLLQRVMRGAGFHPIRIEWWHFEAFSKEETRKRYPVIE